MDIVFKIREVKTLWFKGIFYLRMTVTQFSPLNKDYISIWDFKLLLTEKYT